MNQVFFNVDEFACTVKYYHSAIGQYRNYTPIFDNVSTSINIADESFNDRKPQIQLPTRPLLHRIVKGDKVTLKGKVYFVEDFDDPGVGVVTIFLRLK